MARNLGNKRPENHKESTKFFGKGISNRSVNEIQGAINQDNYLYSRNGRISTKTSFNSVERINGEVNKYIILLDTEDENDYFCIGSTNINNRIVAFWANVKWMYSDPRDGVITIDGDVVCKSEKLPLRHLYRLDFDKDENCLGGEIFITDNNLPPMYFNIKDLLDNFASGSQKYFDDFDYRDYTINVVNSLEVLVFTELRNVGGGNGRPVGQEVYSYRSVTNDGDRTNWSVATPMIVIPRNLVTSENPANLFKYTSTRGDDTDKTSRTAYAPVLKLRIDNTQGYNYIEVKRTSYNNGESLGYTPTSYIIQRIPIDDNQFNIIEIVDSASNETDEITVAPNDDTGNASSVIKRAEAIRYFKNKIELANIEYEEIDVNSLEIEYREVSGKIADPVMKFLGEKGHRDPVNGTYFKSHLSGEKESFSLVLWNENLQRTFVIPIEDLDNFMFPDKRKNTDGFPESINLSNYLNGIHKFVNSFNGGSPLFNLPSQDTNEVEEVFEIVLHTSSTLVNNKFPDADDYIDIKRPTPAETPVIINITENSQSGAVQYKIRSPKDDNDLLRDNERNYSAVKSFDRGIDYDIGAGNDFVDYTPDGFSDQFQALGLGIHGISGFPDWCRAFSIAKTKPARRVIAQGIGVFPLKEMGVTIGTATDVDFPTPGQNEPTEPVTPSDVGGSLIIYSIKDIGNETVRPAVKESAKKIHIHIPDFDSGLLSIQEVQEIINNPQNYKLQFVEPVGYYTEPFGGDIGVVEVTPSAVPLTGWIGEKTDIVTYARVQNELLMTNCGAELVNSNPFSEPHAYFAGNRSVSGNVITLLSGWLGGQVPNADGWKTDIVSIVLNTENEEGLTYLEVEVSDDIWNTLDTPFHRRSMDDDEVKAWQEHFYIVNIINDSAEIPKSSNQEFLAPINFIKLESKVGLSAGLDSESFETNNERLEDFQVIEDSTDVNFIYIRKVGQEADLRFINITELVTVAPGDIATIDSDIDNGTTIYCGEVLNGKYKTSDKNILIDIAYSYTVATITANRLAIGDEVYVKYNNQNAVSIFGGDIMQNNAVFPYKHRKCISNGRHIDPLNGSYGYIYPQDSTENQFKLGIGFPSLVYEYSEKVKKHIFFTNMINADNFQADTPPFNTVILNFIRQWLILYTCQARTNLSYAYGDFFPNHNYIERPLSWEPDKTVVENKVFEQYETDYPNEQARWTLGGFQVQQLANKNLDFSKTPEHDKLYARAVFLQETSQRYCNRVIWSATRPIQNYGSPSLKTFRPFNYRDISDRHGDIRKLLVISNNKGDNLYAMCENDITLLLTNKNALTDASGNLIATSTDDTSFIPQEIWTNVGQNKGLQKLHKWSLSENGNSVFYANENGVFEFNGGEPEPIFEGNNAVLLAKLQEEIGVARYINGNAIILECLGYSYYDNKYKEYCYCIKFPYIDVKESIVTFESEVVVNNVDITDANGFVINITDVGENVDQPYNTGEVLQVSIYNNSTDNKVFYILKTIPNDIEIILYNKNGDTETFSVESSQYTQVSITEEGVDIEDIDKEVLEDMAKLYVYCDEKQIKAWSSEFDYRFDSVTSFNGKNCGLTQLRIKELNTGNELNNEPIEFEVSDVINSNQKEEIEENKEWIAVQVNSKKDIDKTAFSIDFYDKETGVPFQTLQGTNMKNYGGLWQYIPRNAVTGKRYQDAYLLYKLKYNGEEGIAITSVQTQFKILK